MKTFTKVRSYLSSIPSIHNGGCGISAYAMYLWLETNSTIRSVKFVMCYNNDFDIMTNARVFHNEKGRATSCSHVGIIYKGKPIDCEDPIDLLSYRYIQIVRADWFLVNMIKNKRQWNSAFDRKRINDIEYDLGIDMSPLYT